MQAGCTSGYYEAANFDWFAKVKFSGMIDGYIETFEYEHDELEAEYIPWTVWKNSNYTGRRRDGRMRLYFRAK